MNNVWNISFFKTVHWYSTISMIFQLNKPPVKVPDVFSFNAFHLIKFYPWNWRSYCPNMQDKTINNTYQLGGAADVWLTDKNMPMGGLVYMIASIAIPRLAANHHPGNGLGHLRIMECLDAHIIFPSSCSSLYSLWCVIQHMFKKQDVTKLYLVNMESTAFYF